MLNGSKRNAPAANKARLIAISPPAEAVAQGHEVRSAEAVGDSSKLDPKRMQWFVIPLITLLSALAGGIAAWLLR